MQSAFFFFFFITTSPLLDCCCRLAVSCILGMLIGIERSKRFKEAGVRTHIVVCCGAALCMIVSKYGFADLGGILDGSRTSDPARLAAQVVSGIGFLGAGVIFKNGYDFNGALMNQMELWQAQVTESKVDRRRDGTTEYDLTVRRRKEIEYAEMKAFMESREDVISASNSPIR